MISYPLLKHNLKTCLLPFLVIFLLLTMYTSVIIYMYNPELSSMLSGYQEVLPEMMAAVGMTGIAESLLDWIQIYLYGFIMLLFPLIFIIIAVQKFVMSYIDRGSIAGLLATPNSRGKIIRTQLFSLYLWLVLLMAAITVVGFFCCEGMFPGELDRSSYLLLNLGTLMLWFAIAGIAFLAACCSSESKYYYLFGAGIPIVFFLFQMLGNMGDDFSFLKYLTIYSLFQADNLVAGDIESFLPCVLLLFIGFVLSGMGCVFFQKRDFSV